MKTLELTVYGIPLTVSFWQHEKDCYSHSSGHYTVPDKWRIETIEHEGIDITEVVSDEVWHILEKEANDENEQEDF